MSEKKEKEKSLYDILKDKTNCAGPCNYPSDESLRQMFKGLCDVIDKLIDSIKKGE